MLKTLTHTDRDTAIVATMNNTTKPQVLETITKILTTPNTPLETLTPHLPNLTQPLFLTLLSSKTLSSRPSTLLSFFKFVQSRSPSLTSSPHSLLSLLPSLFAHKKFSDAKSLLVSFIASDRHHELHRFLLHPPRLVPEPSKAVLDTSIGAYVQSKQPHLAMQIFHKMKRLHFTPNLLTCNTLLNALEMISVLLTQDLKAMQRKRRCFSDMMIFDDTKFLSKNPATSGPSLPPITGSKV